MASYTHYDVNRVVNQLIKAKMARDQLPVVTILRVLLFTVVMVSLYGKCTGNANDVIINQYIAKPPVYPVMN